MQCVTDVKLFKIRKSVITWFLSAAVLCKKFYIVNR